MEIEEARRQLLNLKFAPFAEPMTVDSAGNTITQREWDELQRRRDIKVKAELDRLKRRTMKL